MAGELSKKKTAQLRRLMQRLYDGKYKRGEDVRTWSGNGKSLRLDVNGFYVIRDAAELLQTVEAWKNAYPFGALEDRIAWAMIYTESIDEAMQKLLGDLAADTKEFMAYALIFGFNLTGGAKITFGKYVLEALGEEGVEAEIIDRLKQHVATREEQVQLEEIERYRKLLEKHKNVPTLRVPFYGSRDGAVATVSPTAERAAAFVQFAIGMLTDQNEHIIDYRGRFTGEFSAFMPILTPEFDELDFPNVRGVPYRQALGPDSIRRLDEMGVLKLAGIFIQPVWAPEKSIDAMLCRAASCFADGERAVTDLAKIVSYVSAVEVLFGKKDAAQESFCLGLAVSTHREREGFDLVYDMAKEIYQQRSDAAHKGISPTFQYVARRKAVEAIRKVLCLRETLKDRNELRAWVAERVAAEKSRKDEDRSDRKAQS